MSQFADRLIDATRRLGPLCVGIDPHASRIPELFGGDTPSGLAAWGMALVDMARGRVAAVKPQVGLFERHGPEGMAALQAVARRAMKAGLIVIMDAKRGDIGSTAEGYAAAYLAEDAPFPSDCLTVNPYMGLDTLEPFLKRAEAHGKGLAVLARTSNPGSADFQALMPDSQPLWAHVATALTAASERLMGATGWSSLMLVAGATGPDEARRLRELAPRALFLVPGYGAQGAGAAEALAGFVAGPQGLEGGLVNASRSVTFPVAAQEAAGFSEWQLAIGQAIDAAQADLKKATQT
ncbi:MAG: orotidine-5'-phosphate decarboxylase [Hyphomonadaceae bacterium]|nr:orotidine-5'-phosphate decarboxylase [Hyphomonadaceae bacterium]